MDKVEKFEFSSFEDCTDQVKSINERKFSDKVKRDDNFQTIIKKERALAKQGGFKISPVVESFRGFKEQEENEISEMIEREVAERVLQIKAQAYEEGLKQGELKAFEETQKKEEAKLNDKLNELKDVIIQFKELKKELLNSYKSDIYTLLKSLGKWIVLRELKDDGAYLLRLLEKLLHEIHCKDNLLIQVNPANFEQMPEVIALVEKKLGALNNVRLEMDPDIVAPGICIESHNGIVNASMDKQLESFDELFSVVENSK